MSGNPLVQQFDDEMLGVYQRARSEAHYNATRFLQMLQEYRGVETAKILIHSPTVSEGYTALWERGRIDLTVEAVIYGDKRWHSLFTEDELVVCEKRLREYGFMS
jgi:hypothetical protein